MNEKPESIWKKSWKGRGALVFVFLLLACAIFVAVFALGLLSAKNNSTKELLGFAFLISVSIAAALPLLFVFLRWLFCWRNLRRALFALACLATLIALFYAEENWRGKHAWEKYKREQEAKGERFDLKSIAPPPVPDDQNFAMTPLWVEQVSGAMGMERAKTWYGDKVTALGHTNFIRPLEMPIELSTISFTNLSGTWQKAEKSDLKVWQEYFRKLAGVTNFFPVTHQPQKPAEDVLLALSKYDSTIEELRAASKLPYSRFPLGYNDDNPGGILLPHLAPLKGCVRTLQLRSSAELEAGHSEKALDDINLMLRLTEAIRNEPITISHLVRLAMLQIEMQPIWEGLAEHNWNDAQLGALDAELGKLDFLADYNFFMRGKRAFLIGVIDHLRRNRQEIENIGPMEREGSSDVRKENTLDKIMNSPLNRLVPRGWFEQNKVAVCQMHSEYFLPIVNLEKRVVSVAAEKRAAAACRGVGTKLTPYNWFISLVSPNFSNVQEKFARAQSHTDLARIACALERYRLAHGTFPETLDALTPQFMKKIPHDIMNGKPLNYRLTTEGQFILYSVGRNETDDGGSVVLGTEKTLNVDTKQGDWVWRYPAK